MLRSASLLLTLVLGVSGQASDEWITVIYKDQFGDPVDFYCNTSLETNQPPNGSIPERWMFNDLSNAPNNFSNWKYVISPDGYQMTILNATEEDFGVYHCMLKTPDDEWYLIKLGLNVRGPYYEDLWEKYRMNTIIGFSAFFGFLLMAAFIMIVYKNQYIVEEEEAKPIDPFMLPDYGLQNGQANAAFTNEKEALENITYEDPSSSTDENIESTVL